MFMFWNSKNRVLRYIDSEYAKDLVKIEFITVYVFSLDDYAISWKAQLQYIVVRYMYNLILTLQKIPFGEKEAYNIYKDIMDNVIPIWDILTLLQRDGCSMRSDKVILSHGV